MFKIKFECEKASGLLAVGLNVLRVY